MSQTPGVTKAKLPTLTPFQAKEQLGIRFTGFGESFTHEGFVYSWGDDDDPVALEIGAIEGDDEFWAAGDISDPILEDTLWINPNHTEGKAK